MTDIFTANGLRDLFLAMADTKQDPKHHPEGDVLTHSLMVYNMTKWRGWGLLSWAALLHDAGKVTTTAYRADGRLTAYGHEKVSAALVRVLKDSRIWITTDHYALTEYVVRNHMKIKGLAQMRPFKAGVLEAEGRAIKIWHRGREDKGFAETTDAWTALQVFSRFDAGTGTVSYSGYPKMTQKESSRFLRGIDNLEKCIDPDGFHQRFKRDPWRLESSREKLFRLYPDTKIMT